MNSSIHPYFFLCNRREMLVSKDLSDCIGCPLRELTVDGVLQICNQYQEAAREKLRHKMGIDLPPDQLPPTDLIKDF